MSDKTPAPAVSSERIAAAEKLLEELKIERAWVEALLADYEGGRDELIRRMTG